jgi:alanine-synthesizing transaminase
MTKTFNKSDKLSDVCYDIRGPVLEEAMRMEAAGQRILRLNIGNPAAFDFHAPDEIIRDVRMNLRAAEGYGPSRGLFQARKAIMQHSQSCGVPGVDVEDVYIGNGVSELIQMAVQALLNDGDEVLIPAPDYPLWTASIALTGGKPVHYRCDEQAAWMPDIDDMRNKITPRTRAIVVINPNNPTGAVYSQDTLNAIVELARQHNLVLFADEIYEHIVYDDAGHIPLASLATDLLCISFNGLSKNYRLAGYRVGWMVISGEAKKHAAGYLEGLNILSSMRLCANMPGQFAVQTALGGEQSILGLVNENGLLRRQRDTAWELVQGITGVSCVKPMGATYLFIRFDKRFNIQDDERFVLDFLKDSHILIVQGSAFNCGDTCHARLVFLPSAEIMGEAIKKLGSFLGGYKQ